VFLSYLLATCGCRWKSGRRLLELADIERQLDADLSSADAKRFDAEAPGNCPKRWRNWKIVWFADEHKMANTWLIWDVIIAKYDNVT
jgi:hypothetical protein